MLMEKTIVKIMEIIYIFLICIITPFIIGLIISNIAIHKSGTQTDHVINDVDHLIVFIR